MTDDETQIRATLGTMAEAWARGDAGAFAACFTEDCNYVTFDGSRARGRARNEEIHRVALGSVLLGTRLEGTLEEIVAIAPGVALVHGTGAVLFPWQRTPSRSALSRQTYVMLRQDGRWLARSFQNTRVKPLPPLELDSPFARLARAFVRFRAWLAGVRLA